MEELSSQVQAPLRGSGFLRWKAQEGLLGLQTSQAGSSEHTSQCPEAQLKESEHLHHAYEIS